MKIGGNLAAQKNLSITNNGKIVFEENKRETNRNRWCSGRCHDKHNNLVAISSIDANNE